jgi:hypothetical protein
MLLIRNVHLAFSNPQIISRTSPAAGSGQDWYDLDLS